MKWEEQDSKLTKKFEAKSFSDICEKLNQLAPIANQMDHHPDFEVSGYKYIQFYQMITAHILGGGKASWQPINQINAVTLARRSVRRHQNISGLEIYSSAVLCHPLRPFCH